MPDTAIVNANPEMNKWDQAVYAFLAEKERRSVSRRTVESYARMLNHAFAAMGTTPDRVTRQDVFSWVHGAVVVASSVA